MDLSQNIALHVNHQWGKFASLGESPMAEMHARGAWHSTVIVGSTHGKARMVQVLTQFHRKFQI
eukprot:6272582-Ditylum_brightwellii.AAC.1